jgi:hypothetical protein
MICLTSFPLCFLLAEGSSWEEGTHRSRNPSVVLNYELGQNKLGAGRTLIGKSITMDDAPYQITGVAGPGFQFPVRSDIFRAAFLGGAQSGETRSLYVVGRLRRGITLTEAHTRLNAFANRMAATYPQTNREIKFRLNSLRFGDTRIHRFRHGQRLQDVVSAALANSAAIFMPGRRDTRNRPSVTRNTMELGGGMAFMKPGTSSWKRARLRFRIHPHHLAAKPVLRAISSAGDRRGRERIAQRRLG